VKAGLHTGNAIASFDGQPIRTRQVFNETLKTLHPGERVIVGVMRSTYVDRIAVTLTGYQIPVARLIPDKDAGAGAADLYRQWNEAR
jgi:hypothetical protein